VGAPLKQMNLGFDSADWLNSEEAAEYLRILKKDGSPCVMRLRNLVSQGRLPFYKPFGRLLFKRSELAKLIETSRQGVLNVY
jgi:excisionase family DNA binding protein